MVNDNPNYILMVMIMNHGNHQIKRHLIAAGESIAYTLVRFPVKHHLTPISIIISPPTHPKKNCLAIMTILSSDGARILGDGA